MGGGYKTVGCEVTTVSGGNTNYTYAKMYGDSTGAANITLAIIARERDAGRAAAQ